MDLSSFISASNCAIEHLPQKPHILASLDGSSLNFCRATFICAEHSREHATTGDRASPATMNLSESAAISSIASGGRVFGYHFGRQLVQIAFFFTAIADVQ